MRIRPRFDSRAGPKSWEMSEPTVGRAKPQGRGRRAPLDATDPAILGLLASDARMSLRRIARELGMSPPAITDGVAGLIRKSTVSRQAAAPGGAGSRQ